MDADASVRLDAGFRFAPGDRVQVLTHPERPVTEVVARIPADVTGDFYGEPIYEVRGFVTRQRESSLAREGFRPLGLDPRVDWRLAGRGQARRVGPGTLAVESGPGILWYPREVFADFVLIVDWRVRRPDDNSGVFVRIPPLGAGESERDWMPAVEHGYEIQIDDRGVDPETGRHDSPLHATGAIYRRAPARRHASRPPGEWNTFEIEARGPVIRVRLNGVEVCAFDGAVRPAGHVGLQAHHPGGAVEFRSPQVRPLVAEGVRAA